MTQKAVTKFILPPHQPAMLVVDIENTPTLGWSWDMYNTNIIDVERYWYMLSFAYGWYDLSKSKIGKVGFHSIYQSSQFKPDTADDSWLIARLWHLIDAADIVIGQNSRAFDVKKFNSRAIINGLKPPSPYTQIDTKIAAQQVGRFTSNSLKHLTRELGIAQKENNRGFEMWRECMAGKASAWKEMEHYNKADVVATAELYTVLRPWMTGSTHPNLGLYITAEGRVCTKCANKEREAGGQGFQYRGNRVTNASLYKAVRCNKCGNYSREYQRQPQNTDLSRVELRP